MGKKIKFEYSLMPASSIDDVKVFHVLIDSGDGYQHEYIIKALDVESGTLYSMHYSDNVTWSEELRGVNIFHLLNTGNGYEWIDGTQLSNSMGYDEFYLYSTFFRLIQQIESSDRFTTKILEIKELETFNF
jgi:hypothetical protein